MSKSLGTCSSCGRRDVIVTSGHGDDGELCIICVRLKALEKIVSEIKDGRDIDIDGG